MQICCHNGGEFFESEVSLLYHGIQEVGDRVRLVGGKLEIVEPRRLPYLLACGGSLIAHVDDLRTNQACGGKSPSPCSAVYCTIRVDRKIT